MRRWIPSPSLAIAMLALVVAVGGGTAAIALRGKGSVHTDDIRKGAVTAKKIRAGAVNPSKTSLTKFDFAGPEVSTTSNPPVTLSGGPSVTVFVPKGALVAVYAEVEARITNGSEFAQVHLFEPTFLSAAPVVMSYPGGGGFAVRQTTPGSGEIDGVGSALRGGLIIVAPPPGTYTFSLRYSAAGGATALFRNRAIWAGVLN